MIARPYQPVKPKIKLNLIYTARDPRKVLQARYIGFPTSRSNHCTFINSLGRIIVINPFSLSETFLGCRSVLQWLVNYMTITDLVEVLVELDDGA